MPASAKAQELIKETAAGESDEGSEGGVEQDG